MRTAVVCTVLLLAARVGAAPLSAADLFDQGEAAYKRGDYATAIATWQHLYRLSAEPELLFDVAQAYRLAGDCPRALEMYRRFLSTPSDSARRSLASEIVGELTARCDPPATRSLATRSLPSGTSSLQRAGLVTASGGAVVLVAGLVVGHHAAAIGDEVSSACAVACAWSTERAPDADGRRDATIGRMLDGVGLAAIVVGVGLYAWGAWESPPVTVRGTAGGASLSWSGSW